MAWKLSVFFGLCLYHINLIWGKGSAKSKSDPQFADSRALQSSITVMSALSADQSFFRDKKALPTLQRWAADIVKDSYSVSHNVAVHRESEVVAMVEAGSWSPQAYHDYQRLAAGTGNVDSARLMMDYGVGATLMQLEARFSEGGGVGRDKGSGRRGKRANLPLSALLYRSIRSCDLKSFMKITQDHPDYGSWVADDGTNPLHASAYACCVPVASRILSDMEEKHDVVFPFGIDDAGLHGTNALLIASARCEGGALDMIPLLVNRGGASMQWKHRFASTTALHVAAEMNRSIAVEVLCGLGADTSAMTSTGSTALHTAAHAGSSAEVVRVLVKECRMDVDTLMNEDTTPLYLAAQHGHANTVQALLEVGASVGFSMPRTEYKGDKHVVPGELGRSQWTAASINSEAGNGAQPLHAAAEEGHAEVVRVLLAGGADVNSVSIGTTALHLAIQYNRPDVVSVLLNDPNIDVNVYAPVDGCTALYSASSRGLVHIASQLLQSGSDVHRGKLSSGASPLLIASLQGHADMVTALLQAGADVNQGSARRDLTPLHAAVSSSCVTCVKRLLTSTSPSLKTTSSMPLHLVDVFSVVTDEQTTLHFAVRAKSSEELLSVLVKHAMDECRRGSPGRCMDWLWRGQTSDGATPLHLSVISGKVKETQFLLSTMTIAAQLWSTVKPDLCPHMSTGRVSPLYLAVQSKQNSAELIRLMLRSSSGCNPNEVIQASPPATALLTAIDRGNLPAVIALLEPAALSARSCSAEGEEETGDGDCSTSSHTAHPLTDPNLGVGSGVLQAPILLAVVRGRADMVAALLRAGATCRVVVQSAGPGGLPVKESLVDIAHRRRDFDTLQSLTSHKECTDVVADS